MPAMGFSLFELLITILILSIVTALGFFHWGDIKLRHELIESTKQLTYFLNEVQVDAYLTNQNYYLYVFSAPWCLAVTAREKPQSCQGTYRFTLPYNSITIESGTENKGTIFWGQRNMAQTATFRLKNSIGMTKVIISYRGRIRMCAFNSHLSGIPSC